MTRQARKPREKREPNEEPVIKEKKDKRPHLHVIENPEYDAHTQEVLAFETNFGEMPADIRKLSLDKVKIFHTYVKVLDAFKTDYKKILNHFGSEPTISVLGSGDHAEINFVFKGAKITNLVESESEAAYRERLGVHSEKFNPITQLSGEPVDIMIAFYEDDAEPSVKFEKNIQHGGLLLCRAKMAKELLEEGANFKFLGTLNEQESLNRSEKSSRTDYWKQGVKTDAEFEAASSKVTARSSLVTYEDAIATMHAAKWPSGEKSNSVLENYRELIKTARENPDSKIDEERGTITYKDPSMEEPVVIKTEFPFGEVGDGLIFVLQKRRAFEPR